ncbi:MAG: Ldh family oxidoreductase, partial [Candidatus Aminicenantes bacterium]|nr:Ldh family oxidoreductase [Candidatus Aminicenantes bacterium]
MKDRYAYVSAGILESFMRDIFIKLGVNEEDSRICADVLISSDKYGIESHGINRFKAKYYDQIIAGIRSTSTNLKIVKDRPNIAVVDAQGGMGHVAGKRSMAMAIEKAKKADIGMTVVKNSGHFGFAGYYPLMAAGQNMIGIAGTNSTPLVAPTFGAERMIGTNPIAISVPSDEEFPFLLDMATSVKATGKVAYLESCHKKIPVGWVIDEKGDAITNSKGISKKINDRKAVLLPLGGLGEETAGYKGYGLATIVEILCSALSGGAFLSMVEVHKDGKVLDGAIGHFFMAINISSFIELDTFKKITGDILRELRSAKKTPEAERIYTAGEKEYLAWKDREINGIPINRSVQEEILIMKKE